MGRNPYMDMHWKYSLGWEPPAISYKPEHPPNYTEPGKRSIVDIFKGKDDEDLLFKTAIMSRYTFLGAATASLFDIHVGTQPKNLAGMISRCLYWGVPIMGGGIAYTATVCAAASLRKKDDQWNHGYGGIAWGIVAGASKKNYFVGFWTGLIAAFVGAMYKESIMLNYEIFRESPNKHPGWMFSHKSDFTLWKDIKGNWYTDPTPMPPGSNEPPSTKC